MLKKALAGYLGDDGARIVARLVKRMTDTAAPVTLVPATIDRAFADAEAIMACGDHGLVVESLPKNGAPGELLVLKPGVLKDPVIKAALDRHGPWNYTIRK